MISLREGDIIADKYRVDRVLGAGGMGIVVEARHIELDRRVAIKVLRAAMVTNENILERFRREARAVIKLKNEHVARVFDVDTLGDGTPYIVMEYLDGTDLGALAKAESFLPVADACDHVLQACEAVAEAHALGIVHRDLKPANLFLARGAGGIPTIKVLDFGVAKSAEFALQDDLTSGGAVLGSPGYMSPEQITSARDVDARADIWSLGAILYRLVGGAVPYAGDTVVSFLSAMALEPVAPLATLRDGIPAGFEEVVRRCLAEMPDARFGDVASLAAALLPFASPRGRVSAERISAAYGTGVPSVSRPRHRVVARPRSATVMAVALAIATLVVVSALVVHGVPGCRLAPL